MKTKQSSESVNWVVVGILAYTAVSLYLTYFNGSRLPIVLAFRRDIRDLAVVGWNCSLVCNILPSAKRVQCTLTHVAMYWLLKRKHFKKALLHDAWMVRMYSKMCLTVFGTMAQTMAKHIRTGIEAYSWVIDMLCLLGARWRKKEASLGIMEMDPGWSAFQELAK